MIDLRAVGEVAELRLPQHQRARIGQRVAVLEAQHAGLRQQRVVDLDLRLVGRDVVQRDVFVLVGLVDQHRVALAERAALAVLAGQADAAALQQQRAERQRLAGGPVDALAGLEHRLLGFELAGDLADCTSNPAGTRDSAVPICFSVGRGDGGGFLGCVRILRLGGWKPDQWPSSQSALFGL